jgi:hypothetical protein
VKCKQLCWNTFGYNKRRVGAGDCNDKSATFINFRFLHIVQFTSLSFDCCCTSVSQPPVRSNFLPARETSIPKV